jgi:hypothetical protein
MLVWTKWHDGGRRGSRPSGAVPPAWLRILRPRRPHGDPFETLEVQLALTRLDQEIKDLRYGRRDDFAGAHHLRAAMKAYDHVLDDACRLAGVGSLPGGGTSIRRMLAEAELQARGWDW